MDGLVNEEDILETSELERIISELYGSFPNDLRNHKGLLHRWTEYSLDTLCKRLSEAALPNSYGEYTLLAFEAIEQQVFLGMPNAAGVLAIYEGWRRAQFKNRANRYEGLVPDAEEQNNPVWTVMV